MPAQSRNFSGAISGVWLAVMLTGVVNPRYRFVFEPFCLLYAGLLLDFLWSAMAPLFNLPAKRTPSEDAALRP